MASVERIRRDLESIDSASADTLRERVVNALHKVDGSDGSCFFTVHPTAHGYVFGAVHASNPADSIPQPGAPIDPARALSCDITNPAPGDTLAFSIGCERWVKAVKQPLLAETVYKPNGVFDDLRVLVYNGPQFVGWAGMMRTGKGRHFDLTDSRRLQPLLAPVQRLLRIADSLDETRTERPMHFVMSATGSVRHATSEAMNWVSPRRLQLLKEWISALDSSAGDFSRLIDSTQAHAVRLDGPDGTAYLVTLNQLGHTQRLGIESLTPSQRNVALLLTTGATAEEVGRAIGRSPETVRAHAKAIYKRLCISTRAELVGAVQCWRDRLQARR